MQPVTRKRIPFLTSLDPALLFRPFIYAVDPNSRQGFHSAAEILRPAFLCFV